MGGTAYVAFTGFAHSGPPVSNGLLCWEAVVLGPDGSLVPSPDFGSPAMGTYQIQAGDTGAAIGSAVTGQVQAEWGDSTLAVTFISAV